MDNEERQLRHIEMIQGVINRLAGNSSSIRRWGTILMAALVVGAFTTDTPAVAFVGAGAAIFYWLLDSYYLWQERRFRGLYDCVRSMDPEDVDFAMATPQRPFWKAALSATESLFYLALVVTQVAAGLVLIHMSRSSDVGHVCCPVPW